MNITVNDVLWALALDIYDYRADPKNVTFGNAVSQPQRRDVLLDVVCPLYHINRVMR